ncbi:MAG: hypothetical protein ISR72_11785 [Methylobacter sp.]|nr:hypothetical protein [Methylobacter sp.]
MNKYGIKNTINHEVHEGHEENARSINALNLHVLHGYFFYIEYFDSLSGVGMHRSSGAKYRARLFALCLLAQTTSC